MGSKFVRACVWICAAIVVGGGGALAVGFLLCYLEALPSDWGKYYVSVFAVGVALVAIAAKVWYAPQARGERQEVEKPVAEPDEEQPTCSLERYKTKPPYRQGKLIEIPVSILSLKADIILRFRLRCEPMQRATWQRGDTFFRELEDIGGELGESTPIPAGEPVVGSAAFRLEAEYFTGADLWLDLQYGNANPLHIDRSEFCVHDT